MTLVKKDAAPPVFIQGAALSVSWAVSAMSLTDLIFRTVREAVDDSQVEMEEIGSVVLSAHDLVDGRSLSSMVTAPAAGAYLRDEIRLAEDGLAAASLAAARIVSAETEYSIVAAWGRASEGDFFATSRASFDPFMAQPFYLNEFDVSAFRLSAWIARYGRRDDDRARALHARRERAKRNSLGLSVKTMRPAVNYPLVAEESLQSGDVVVAAVFGRRKRAIRIAGSGHSAETHDPGARDLLAMPALKDAVRQAREEAGISSADIGLYEIAGQTLADEALALEALELAAPGQGFAVYADTPSINPSGGGERGVCFPSTGLHNLVECYLRMKDGAGPRHALATGMSPMGGQIAHAIVLEAT